LVHPRRVFDAYRAPRITHAFVRVLDIEPGIVGRARREAVPTAGHNPPPIGQIAVGGLRP